MQKEDQEFGIQSEVLLSHSSEDIKEAVEVMGVELRDVRTKVFSRRGLQHIDAS